jgi:ketosteroid isomerase-like protein
MSDENVEICRRAFEGFEGLDPEAAVEASLEYVHPEIVFQSAIVSGAEGKTFRGLDGYRQWASESGAAFDELRTVPEEFRDLGDDVLMFGRVFAKGRGSGVAVESPVAFLCTLRDGRLVHVRGYLSWDQALEAAGLED